MMRYLLLCFFMMTAGVAFAQPAETVTEPVIAPDEYTVGVDDVLEIAVLQPERLVTESTVAPDGTITFPYIGNVPVKGMTLTDIQNEIQGKLADGYMKYPVVTVSLKEARSRKFFVYGEVMRPGTFYLTPNTTVLRAITMAGGFTKFGSRSHVKVLRPKKGQAGYDTIKINIRGVMNGNSQEDVIIEPEDIVVVSEGMF